jgi:DNA-binding transcriptional LysR family regulator
MDTEALKVFMDVIRVGSFAEVARHHDIDPSSVSRTIAALEAELGFRLFQRTTRRLSPTDAGHEYFERIEPLLEELEHAATSVNEATQRPSGTIRVTATNAFGQDIFIPLLPKLNTLYPDLEVELILTEQFLDLVSEQIDLAVRFGPKPTGNLAVTYLMPTRFLLCASPAYLSENNPIRDPHDLTRRDCLHSVAGRRAPWKFRRPGESAFEILVRGRLIVTDVISVKSYALQGLGPALLPEWFARKELGKGSLVHLLPDYEVTLGEFDRAGWLVYPTRRYFPLKLRAMIEFLQSELTPEAEKST